MKKLSQWFFQGVLAILPVGVTIAVLYYLGTTAEATLGQVLRYILPDHWYVPGMGILSGLVCIILFGLLLNAYLFRKMAELVESLFTHIPLVKIIYGSVKDIAKFASGSKSGGELQSAVLVTLPEGIQLIGFVTDKNVQLVDGEKRYAVYLPMSYQIGGYTLFLPESRLQKLDMSAQDAMRYVLTAAMTAPGSNQKTQ